MALEKNLADPPGRLTKIFK